VKFNQGCKWAGASFWIEKIPFHGKIQANLSMKIKEISLPLTQFKLMVRHEPGSFNIRRVHSSVNQLGPFGYIYKLSAWPTCSSTHSWGSITISELNWFGQKTDVGTCTDLQ